MTKSLEPSGYGETFASWASRLREDCSRRQKWARRTSDGGCSSSLWPTARASDGEKGGPNQSFGAGGTSLPAMAAQWPIATACDWKGSGPTLERADGKMRGDRLDYAAERLWMTPDVPNGGRRLPGAVTPTGMTPDGKKRQVGLITQVMQWPTPTSLSFAGSHQPGNSRSYNETMRLACSLPAPETSPDGAPSSKERRSLNPRFVSWLMNWPPRFTEICLTDPASTNSVFLETGWYLYRQLSLSAFSRIALPPEAPQEQPSFLP